MSGYSFFWKSVFRAIVLLAFTVALSACDDAADREANYLERGKSLYEQEEYTKARLEFRNVLQINPKSAEALYYLGRISEEGDDFSAALRLYQRALLEDPKLVSARVQLGNLYLLANKLEDAQEQIDAISAVEPDNLDGKILTATLLFKRGELEATAKLSANILADIPNHARAAPLYASAVSRLGRPEEGLAVLDAAIGAHPDNTRLIRLKIQFLIEANKLDQAEAAYRILIERSDELAARADMAWFLINQNRLDDAETLLRSVVSRHPDSLGAQQLLVDFLRNHRGFDAAEKQLLAYIAEQPEQYTHYFGLASIYRSFGKDDKAVTLYQRVIDKAGDRPDGIVARAALAKLLLEQNRTEEAEQLVNEVLERDPGNESALLLRGQLAFSREEYDPAITDLRTVLRDNPQATTALGLLAQAHLRSGQTDLAMDALRNLYTLQPNDIRVITRLAQLNILSGNMNEAERWLNEAAEVAPDSYAVVRARISFHLARQDLDQAASETRKLISVPALEQDGRLILGKILRVQKHYDAALEQFDRVLEIDPSSDDAVGEVVLTLMSAGRMAEAENRLQKQLESDPRDANSLNLLGVLYAGSDRSREMFEPVFRRAAEIETAWHAPLLNLGNALADRGSYGEALIALQQGLKRAPENPDVTLALGRVYQKAGDIRSAIATYELMRQRGQGGGRVANDLAALIADYEYEDSARLEYAYQLVAAFRDSQRPEELDTLGWVYYRLGNLNEAEKYVREAVDKGLTAPEVYYHLGMIYAAAGDTDAARENLERATATGVAPYPGLETATETLRAL